MREVRRKETIWLTHAALKVALPAQPPAGLPLPLYAGSLTVGSVQGTPSYPNNIVLGSTGNLPPASWG